MSQLPASNIQPYLDQARKMLTDDYNKRHSDEYNQWILNHKNAWMKPQVIVPFPPFMINAAIAPFTPSAVPPTENEIVASALALYNNANPIAAPVDKVVPDEVPQPEPIATQPGMEAPVASVVDNPKDETTSTPEAPEEPPIVPPTPYVDEIYKIYEAPDSSKPTEVVKPEPLLSTIEQDLKAVPQPAEELAKVTSSGRILPTVLQRLQSITSKWATN